MWSGECAMKLKSLFQFVSIFLLVGCYTNTVSELRNDPASFDGIIQVDRTPEDTYRALREMARECLEQAPLGTPVVSEGDFDSLIRTGQIRQRMTAQGVLLYMTVIDVSLNEQERTSLKLYTMKGSKSIGVHMPTKADLVRWINGNKKCWAK